MSNIDLTTEIESPDFLSGLMHLFEFDNKADLERYLANNSDLIDLLKEGGDYISKKYNPDRMTLVVFYDEDELWEKIFIALDFGEIDVMRGMDIDIEIVESWIKKNKSTIKGRIIVNTI